MNKGGVIFDFNGTLFWDSEYQETSWDMYLEEHNIELTAQQKREYIHGRNGKDTFEIIFNRKMENDEVERRNEEKEVIYRNECLKHKMELAPGAISLLEHLKSEGIPMAIATAAGKSNVDFFIEKFNLLRYFDKKHIIYNNGTVRGKPHPDLFEKAAETLNVDKEKSIIFEDSSSGIQAALRAKAAAVVIVNSTNDSYSEFDLTQIKHFDEFDRATLKLVK